MENAENPKKSRREKIMAKCKRLTVSNGVGKARQQVYAASIDQYKKAINNGFYVEAIALMESLICDRLESHANSISPFENQSFSTTGKLAEFLLGKKQFLYIGMEQTLKDIKQWAHQRNIAIHEMAKFTGNDYKKSFETKYKELRTCAKDGFRLFKEYDNKLKAMRRYLKKNEIIYVLKPLPLPKEMKKQLPNELHILRKTTDITSIEDGIVVGTETYYEDSNGQYWKQSFLNQYYDIKNNNI